MKKLMFALCAGMMAVAANAGCCWSWWVGDDKADKDLKGCQLGIACECKEITGAQVSVLWDRVQAVRNGAQVSIFGVNFAKKVQNGVQASWWFNGAEHAALQLGLICHNEGGFLPWFVFFNFDKSMFGGGNK